MEIALRPVDVICICSADGEIRPLRLRLEDGDAGMVRVDIEQILRVEKDLRFGAETITFWCRTTICRCRRLLQMKYDVRIHSWCLVPEC